MNFNISLESFGSSFFSVEVIFFFGCPSQRERKILFQWLSSCDTRVAVLIEDREEQFFALRLLFGDRERVRLLFCDKIDEEALKQLCWEVCLKRSVFCFALDYPEERKGSGIHFFTMLSHYQRGIDLLASDYSDLGIQMTRNIISNLKYLPKAKNGLSLKGVFQDIPMIICGAGASLMAHVEYIPDAMRKALIFAGGSAMQVFSSHGFSPSFTASIDSSPPYERFAAQSAFAAPFFYQNRFS